MVSTKLSPSSTFSAAEAHSLPFHSVSASRELHQSSAFCGAQRLLLTIITHLRFVPFPWSPHSTMFTHQAAVKLLQAAFTGAVSRGGWAHLDDVMPGRRQHQQPQKLDAQSQARQPSGHERVQGLCHHRLAGSLACAWQHIALQQRLLRTHRGG